MKGEGKVDLESLREIERGRKEVKMVVIKKKGLGFGKFERVGRRPARKRGWK